MTDTAMGLREFGRLVGLSGEGVRKAIKTGRIPAAAMGTVACSTGKLRPAIVDVALARSSLSGNTDPTWQRDRKVLSDNRRAAALGEAPPPRAAAEVETEDDRPAGKPAAKGKNSDGLPPIVESNQRIAAAKAQIAVLELNERRGKLVNAEAIRIRLTTMITTARAKMLGIPTKAKGRIPTLTVHDIETLEELIVDALTELATDGS